jgi:hypothetical protein
MAPPQTGPSHAAPTYGPPGEPGYDRTYPPSAYHGPGSGPTYDAVTEVFDRGLLNDPYADAQTGVIPMPGEASPHDAAPPTGGFAPPPGGFGPGEPTGPRREPGGVSRLEPGEWDPADDDAPPLFTRLRRIRSHAMKRPSRGWVSVLVAILLVGAVSAARFWPSSPWYYGGTEAEAPEVAPMPLRSTEITAAGLGIEGFLSWAYEDIREGTVVGSANRTETTEAGPLLTAWFGADLLRRAAENGEEPSEAQLADIEAMIRDEDRSAADRVVAALDDVGASLDRLGTMCYLTHLTPVADAWPQTTLSAQDAARLGACLADGRAAGAEWTPWLLTVMRQVEGSGIRDAFPAGARAMIAVANGVMLDEEDGQWRANCLALSETWSLAVMRRFPASDNPNADLANVEVVCQRVAQELLTAGGTG